MIIFIYLLYYLLINPLIYLFIILFTNKLFIISLLYYLLINYLLFHYYLFIYLLSNQQCLNNA